MSSSRPYPTSSPSSPASTRRCKSRFTFKHLAQLALSSTSCPLRVIAHIDLDAFYAQCEAVRLGISEDIPLAVQQWQGLIAINYPARKFGIGRFANIAEARKACPDLVLQHVATWKEGQEKWAYHEDAFSEIATHKVSLDPYRLQSRKILALIKKSLPGDLQKVEKASIDEVFCDLSAQVHSIMLERYPELQGPPPYDDPTEKLPAPPITVLDWNADALIDLDQGQTETDDPDWDDVAMLVGSEIVRKIRAAVRKELSYTCSAGIARNKMLAKLGSGHKKPNNQTIIRNRAIQQFLGDFKFTKIRNLGGKLGDEIVGAFNTDTVKDLLEVPLDQLKRKIGDDTGMWLYNIIRGEDTSDVNSRTQVKSMLSAKSFRPSINTFEQATKWLRIFVADIFSRLVEEGVLENKRRPNVVNLHHRQSAQTRSRQAPIPQGRSIDEALLFDIAKNLLAQVVVDGRAWPCANLSLSVAGFEEGVTGNRGISGFLVRGEEARAMQLNLATRGGGDTATSIDTLAAHRSVKRRRVDNGAIDRFFMAKSSHEESWGEGDQVEDQEPEPEPEPEQEGQGDGGDVEDACATPPKEADPQPTKPLPPEPADFDDLPSGQPGSLNAAIYADMIVSPVTTAAAPSGNDVQQQKTPHRLGHYTCPRCSKRLLLYEQTEHEDWHFARDLQAEDRKASAAPVGNSKPQHTASVRSRGGGSGSGGRGGGGGIATQKTEKEKGQKRLDFGRPRLL